MIKNDDIEQKRFIPFSAFYPFFRVLSLFPRFIPFSAFYPFFRVLSPFPRFISFSAFYPFFRVLSLFPRFIPFSASAIPYFRNSESVFYPNPNRAEGNISINVVYNFIPRCPHCKIHVYILQ